MSHLPTGIFSGAWGQSTQEPQTSGPKPPCLAKCCHCQSKNRTLWKLPPTPLPPIVADVDTARCTTPPSGTERENQYLLVITASVEQLSLGPSGNHPKRSTTDIPKPTDGCHFLWVNQGSQLWRCHHKGIEGVRWIADLV